MKKTATILLSAGFAHLTCAQDLNGYWKGTLGMVGCFPNNNIELQISIKEGAVTGDSYHYQDINNYVKKKFRGAFDPVQKKLTVHEGMVTTYNIPKNCVICVKNFELVYSRKGNIETLQGYWGGHVINTPADCGIGPIILTRIKESAFKDIPEIKVDTGAIRLEFYDNAQIDGDSITVKVNNRVVLSHQRLGIEPLTHVIQVDFTNTFYEVEMVAENLGSIPPNTAILVVIAGKKTYRLSLSSSEEKSARVRFVYEPDADSRTAGQYAPLQIITKAKGDVSGL